ncbi:MAG: hypothetical protein R3C11_16915 [Planctomycetaceae bacterium]
MSDPEQLKQPILEQFKNDFRYDAMVASLQKMYAEEINPQNPWSANFSYCLPARNYIRTYKRLSLISALLLIAGVVCFLATVVTVFLVWIIDLHIIVPVILLLTGIFLVLAYSSSTTNFTLAMLQGRHIECNKQKDFECIPNVLIEDFKTFSKFKIAPEDMVYVAKDTAGPRIIIEGVLARYMILPQDILKMEYHETNSTSKVTRIVFVIRWN